MHFFVLSTLLGVCVLTKAAKPRSINVALDTVLEFDKSSDIDLIDQVQGILNKVKNILKDNPKTYRTTQYKFTNFLEDAIEVLQSFDDEDLREIVQIVANEMRKHLQGNAFEENVRRFLSDEYNNLKIRSIKNIRKDMDKLLRKVKNGKNKNSDKNFLHFMNTLYKKDSEQKLAKFIRKLKIFRRNILSRKNVKFQQAMRRSLNSVIFEHFMNLSENTKQELIAVIKKFLDAVAKDERGTIHSRSHNKHNPKVALHYGAKAEKFSEVKKKSNNSSGASALDDKKRYASLLQGEYKSGVVKEIRDQSDSSKQLVKKENIEISREMFSEPSNAKRNIKRKIKFTNSKKGPSKDAQRSFRNVKMKQTQYSKKFEERSSREMIRNVNTKLIKSKITQYRKSQTKNPYLKMNYTKINFTLNKTYTKDFENKKLKTVFRNTKQREKDNIEKDENDEISNDISLSSLSNSAEINVNFKNNKMQFVVKDRDDTVEDKLVRVEDSRENPMAHKKRTADKQRDQPTNRQINSQDSTDKRHQTYNKRFKTVSRSRRLFKGEDNIDKYSHRAPKLIESEQDKYNTNSKNVDKQKINIKKSPKVNDFRRRDYILAKEIITDTKMNARKKLDQNHFNNIPQYAGYQTIRENKSHEKFNTNNFKHNDIKAQNNPDGALAKANKYYNFIDDLYIAQTIPVNSRFKTIEITNREQDGENNNAENVADTSTRAIELTTENDHSYTRTSKPDKIDEVSINDTRRNKNVVSDFNIDSISNVFQNIDFKSNEKLSNKSHIDFKTDMTDILKKALENESTVQSHMPQTYTSALTQNIKDLYSNNFRREKIRNVKQNQNEIKYVLKNNNEMFKTDLKPNQAITRDVRRQFNFKTTRNIKKMRKLKHLEDRQQPNIKEILNHSALFNITNKSTDSYRKYINTKDSRKPMNVIPIFTTTLSKIIESKEKEKSNVFKINDSTILFNTTPKTKISTAINTNTNSEILKFKHVTEPKAKINTTREVKKNVIISNISKFKDSRRILSTPKTTTLINLDANLDDLAFEATIADLNTNTIEADRYNFDIEKYVKKISSSRDLPVVEGDPEKEIAKKMKQDLKNIFTEPASSATTTAAYTDIFEALENAFDL